MTFFRWSRVAASDATADTTCPFPEGMAASALNDSSRGQMAALAKFRDDIAGAIVTGGTLNAYTVTSYQGFDTLANLSGQLIAFTPHTTSGDTVTLNVDSLGAKPLRSAPSVELPAGTLIQGTPYLALYNNSDGAFYLRGFVSSPYDVPFLGGIDFWDTVAPNSAFIFPLGQAISRTVYSKAFARWGTTFGVGDGSTTFNVPDKGERVSVMKAAAASRLTTAAGGVDGGTFGATGGAQTETLITANLPPYTPTGSGLSTDTNIASGTLGIFNNGGGVAFNAFINGTESDTARAVNLTMNAQGGTSTPVRTVQPTIVCNYIIRVL